MELKQDSGSQPEKMAKNSHKNKWLWLIIILAVIVAVAIFYFWPKSQPSPSGINPADYLIFEIKKENLSEFQRDRFASMFTNAKSKIEQMTKAGKPYDSNNNFYSWLEIAGAQKAVGDYKRAEKIWLWFNDAYPGNSVSPANLADLYKSFLNDNEKAEEQYRIALKREKNDFNIYQGFFDFYRYNLKDPVKAIAVLKDGIANNPDEIKYVQLLSNYLIKQGDMNQAREIIEDYIKDHPEAKALRDRLK